MTTTLDRAPSRRQPSELAPVGWSAGPELGYDDWLRQGSRLGLAGRNAAWWIGDWLKYGTAQYGTKYSAASRVTGYDRQTLMNMVYVAGRFDFSRRRENLSWSHHAELAAFDVGDQEEWLDHVESERLSVHDLRDELASSRRPAGRARAHAAEPARSTALRAAHAAKGVRPTPARRRPGPSCAHAVVTSSRREIPVVRPMPGRAIPLVL